MHEHKHRRYTYTKTQDLLGVYMDLGSTGGKKLARGAGWGNWEQRRFQAVVNIKQKRILPFEFWFGQVPQQHAAVVGTCMR